MLVVGPGRRGRGRRSADRCREPVRTPRGDAAARLEDNPSYLNFPGEHGHVRYGEGVFVGYRGYDALDLSVSYPFGHGLSYTSFEYTDLTATVTGSVEDDTLAVAVACTVTNTGQRPGKEVVQLYVSYPESFVRRPSRNSKGSRRPPPSPPAPDRNLPAAIADLSYWSVRQHRWVLKAERSG